MVLAANRGLLGCFLSWGTLLKTVQLDAIIYLLGMFFLGVEGLHLFGNRASNRFTNLSVGVDFFDETFSGFVISILEHVFNGDRKSVV